MQVQEPDTEACQEVVAGTTWLHVGQACKWVWDDWDDMDSKGIWEIYASIDLFNAHLLIRLYVFAMLATSPATI